MNTPAIKDLIFKNGGFMDKRGQKIICMCNTPLSIIGTRFQSVIEEKGFCGKKLYHSKIYSDLGDFSSKFVNEDTIYVYDEREEFDAIYLKMHKDEIVSNEKCLLFAYDLSGRIYIITCAISNHKTFHEFFTLNSKKDFTLCPKEVQTGKYVWFALECKEVKTNQPFPILYPNLERYLDLLVSQYNTQVLNIEDSDTPEQPMAPSSIPLTPEPGDDYLGGISIEEEEEEEYIDIPGEILERLSQDSLILAQEIDETHEEFIFEPGNTATSASNY